jgi:hypothetical protein
MHICNIRDEEQDFSPAMFRVLLSLRRPERDDVMIARDAGIPYAHGTGMQQLLARNILFFPLPAFFARPSLANLNRSEKH